MTRTRTLAALAQRMAGCKIASMPADSAKWVSSGFLALEDRMQFDQLKRREFIASLAVRRRPR
jgi:hypothetical protein